MKFISFFDEFCDFLFETRILLSLIFPSRNLNAFDESAPQKANWIRLGAEGYF